MGLLDKFRKNSKSITPGSTSNKCNQCGGTPMYQLEEGHLLCLDCYSKFQQVNQLQLNNLYIQANRAAESIEAATGMPGMVPRFRVQPSNIFTGNINDIKINNSTIGSVNTGNIDKLNVTLSNINASHSAELASSIKQFVEEVLSSPLETEKKNEIIEVVESITAEVATDKETRKQSVIKSLMNAVKDYVTPVNALATLWTNIQKLILSLL